MSATPCAAASFTTFKFPYSITTDLIDVTAAPATGMLLEKVFQYSRQQRTSVISVVIYFSVSFSTAFFRFSFSFLYFQFLFLFQLCAHFLLNRRSV